MSRFSARRAAGPAGTRFCEAQVNPFGTGTIGPKAVRALIPDGAGSVTTPMVLTASYDLSGMGTNGALVTMAAPGAQTTPNGGEKAIIVQTLSDGSVVNTVVGSGYGAYNEISMYGPAAGAHLKGRIVAAGLRCFATSNADNTQGYLQGFLSPKSGTYLNGTTLTLAHASAAALLSSVYDNYKVEESHALLGAKAGLTIRRPYQNNDHELQALPATCVEYKTEAGTTTSMATWGATAYGNMPGIRIINPSTSTTFHIDAVIHMEVEVNPVSWPGFLSTSIREPSIDSLIQYVNSREVVVAGHSFKSIIRRSGSSRRPMVRRRFMRRRGLRMRRPYRRSFSRRRPMRRGYSRRRRRF